ncbi:MAG: hypothetical protein DRG78_10795 [Epsilonproteobacteria bacterium]|nr:MAG: hypothetical protein DRG78_10795 [Campylobacterota bacterium]
MKNLILVSRKPIIIQIFTLVCKKLNLSLEVLSEAQLDHKVDIVVIDNEFIDDRFNILKSYSKLIGAITNEELSFETANDFIIPLPFLPSSLQTILELQIEVLNKRMNSKMYISNVEVTDEEYKDELTKNDIEDKNETEQEDTEQAVEYLESLAEDIAEDMIEETDDSMVSVSSIKSGGILDRSELSAIEEIINYDIEQEEDSAFIESTNNDEEWLDLSSIIDQAIDEVNTVNNIYDKFDNKPIKLLLNNYDLEQLSPLLNMLNQDIIDSLTEGHEINLQLKLGEHSE